MVNGQASMAKLQQNAAPLQASADGVQIAAVINLRSPLAVTASRLAADPKATSTGVLVMLCFMNPMFFAVMSVSLKSLITLSSQAVAKAEPSALKASPPTLSVCPCSHSLYQSITVSLYHCITVSPYHV